MKVFCITSILFLISAASAIAQDMDVEDQLEGEFQPTITDAYKINDNPVNADSTTKLLKTSYAIFSQKVETAYKAGVIKPAKMQGEPLSKLYRAYVKAAYGNFNTLNGEAFYNSLRSRDNNWGIHAKHLSSSGNLKNIGYAGYSDNEIDAYGKWLVKKQSITGTVDYAREVVNHYGYDTTLHFIQEEDRAAFIRQRFSSIGVGAGIKSYYKDSTQINHDATIAYNNFRDLLGVEEQNVKAQGLFSTYIGAEQLKVLGVLDYYNYANDVDSFSNTIITIQPDFSFKGEQWNASIGVQAVVDVWDESTFHFYPNIDFNYNIMDNILIPYAGVRGGWIKNSYRALSDQNPFIFSEATLRNSDQKYEMYAGLRGTLSADIAFNTSLNYSRVKNMPLFVINAYELLQNRFDIVYDDVKVLNLRGQISFQQSQKLKLLAKGNYYQYTTSNELEAWHKPGIDITLGGRYNLKDKFILKADLFVIGKQKARQQTFSGTNYTISTKELKGVADLNLGIDYRYTKLLSFFVQFNNVGAVRYYQWDRYPSQRFNLLGGLSYSF